MGDTYTRQSSGDITSGATIEASHFNNEFDQLVSAFAASSGHTHDGTTGEGGPVTKLLGNTLTFGAGTAGTDITITFDGETSDGVLKWMEDEDYFEFSDDILVASTEKLQFRDTAIYINSSTDGQLDLVADSEVQIAATTIDINGNVDVSGTLTVAGAVDFGDAALSNVGAVQLDSIAGDGDTNTSITFSGSDVITITAGGDAQFTFNNGSILPSTDNDIDLGSSSLEFKDAFFDGTVTTDALVADTADIDAGTIDGVTLGTNSAITQAVIDDVDINGKVITMTGSSSDTAVFTAGTNGTLSIVTTDDSAAAANITITADGTFEADGTTITLDSSGDIVLDADGANVTFKDGGTSILDIANNSTDVDITVVVDVELLKAVVVLVLVLKAVVVLVLVLNTVVVLLVVLYSVDVVVLVLNTVVVFVLVLKTVVVDLVVLVDLLVLLLVACVVAVPQKSILAQKRLINFIYYCG